MKGGQSRLYRCHTTNNGTEPAETASKLYLTTNDKNMTELQIINSAASDAGVRSKGTWNFPARSGNRIQFTIFMAVVR